MRPNARMIATLTAAGAMLALPATGLAAKPTPKVKAKSCATTPKVAYQLGGTLVSAGEGTVTLKITSASAHARRSGDIADQNLTKKGLQVKGATVIVAAPDTFTLKLNGYEGTDLPSAGDRVKVSGKMAVTKKSCAPAGTATADRYAKPDVKTVTISDRDPDA